MWEELLCLLPPLSTFPFVHKWAFAIFLGSRPHWDWILLSIWCFHPLVYHIKREYCELKCAVRKVCSQCFLLVGWSLSDSRLWNNVALDLFIHYRVWVFFEKLIILCLWLCVSCPHIWCNICHIALNKYSRALTSVQAFLRMWEAAIFLTPALTHARFPCISIFDQSQSCSC